MDGPRLVELHLPDLFVGQILDALEVVAEQWEQTACFLDREEFDEAEWTVRECSGAGEANAIAAFYRQIIGAVVNQI